MSLLASIPLDIDNQKNLIFNPYKDYLPRHVFPELNETTIRQHLRKIIPKQNIGHWKLDLDGITFGNKNILLNRITLDIPKIVHLVNSTNSLDF